MVTVTCQTNIAQLIFHSKSRHSRHYYTLKNIGATERLIQIDYIFPKWNASFGFYSNGLGVYNDNRHICCESSCEGNIGYIFGGPVTMFSVFKDSNCKSTHGNKGWV
uniref:Uncharacterized protein n=1 Tax=Anguilla anguilla TaxID=7936 RepID=A0A0E9WRJ0_ANGAN